MIRFALILFAVTNLMPAPCVAADNVVSGTRALVTIPDATEVAVQLDAPATSADYNVDDIINVHVVGAVNVSGYVVIANNAKGRGHVVKVDAAGGHGHGGTIEIVVDYVYSIDGLKIKLKPVPFVAKGERARGDAAVIGFFTFGLGSNAVRGGDATLDPARTLVTSVDGPVHVASSQPADGPNANAPFAK